MKGSAKRVLVLGAGAAGLAAAYELARRGISVTVIEGRDRIGGRVYTLRDPDWPLAIEAGAEFIHGKAEETQTAITALGLATDEVAEKHYESLGEGVTAADIATPWSKVSRRLDLLEDDVPFAEFLRRDCSDLSPRQQIQVQAYVEGFQAADLREVSALWVREADRETGQAMGARRLPDGYERIFDHLTKPPLDIHFNRRITNIRWRHRFVEVDVTSPAGLTETFTGQAAVITLPLSVLQATHPDTSAISWQPDIPEKRTAWNRLRMGSVVKLAILFEHRFWEKQGFPDLSFLHTPSAPLVAWWTAVDPQAALLTGWSGGPRTAQLARLPAAAVLDLAIEILAASFGMPSPHLRRLVRRWMVFDWQSDPFSRGAYSYVPVGGVSLPEVLAKPVDNTLFFAGEATHSRLGGTVSGALASGMRAATEVVGSLE